MGATVLLGPQRLRPTLAAALERAGVRPKAPVAVVTAGWRDREEETEPLRAHLGRPIVNLRLYARSEEVVENDLETSIAHRERLALVLQQQDAYRTRLRHAMAAARELIEAGGAVEVLEPAREAAVEAVREVDAWHLAQLAEIRRLLRERWRVEERPEVQRHRREIEEALRTCEAVAVAGGDVAALRNRFLMFDLGSLLGDLPVFAWSAGAMLLSDVIVLFHDTPPHGAGDPEVLDRGLGRVPGVVAFPHATRRLRLDDPVRVRVMARRFAPATCLAMDEGSRWAGGGEDADVRVLEPDGTVSRREDA